jgi:hypothetical protein
MRKVLIGLGLAGALALGFGKTTTARADDTTPSTESAKSAADKAQGSAEGATKSAGDQADKAANSADEAAKSATDKADKASSEKANQPKDKTKGSMNE